MKAEEIRERTPHAGREFIERHGDTLRAVAASGRAERFMPAIEAAIAAEREVRAAVVASAAARDALGEAPTRAEFAAYRALVAAEAAAAVRRNLALGEVRWLVAEAAAGKEVAP